MKLLRLLLIPAMAFAIISASLPAKAEEPAPPSPRDRWMQEYRQYKHDFLIKEIGLTQEQQDEFFPLYDEMQQSIININREAKEAEDAMTSRTDIPTDEEYTAVAKLLSEAKGKEAIVEIDYFEKFSKILTPKQLFELKRAEDRFSRSMLMHHKRQKPRK